MAEKMGKVFVHTGTWKGEVREYPVPEAADDGMVIKVETFCVCGSDQHMMNLIGDDAPDGCEGHEFMGKIISMGKDANKNMNIYGGDVKVGDRVAVYPHITCGKCPTCVTYGPGICDICEQDFIYGGVASQGREEYLNNDPETWPHFKGGFAEYVYLFPGTFMWKVPDDMDSDIAGLLDPMAVAMRAVEQCCTPMGGVQEGFSVASSCLVLGAGAIGIMAAMILKAMGAAHVVITDFVDKKLELAKEIAGVDVAMNTSVYATTEERVAAVREACGGGANIVINAANHPSSSIEGLQEIRAFGYFVEIGNAMDLAGKGVMDGVNIPNTFFCRNAHITAVASNTPATFDRAFHFLQKPELKEKFKMLHTHRMKTLDDILPTMNKMRDPDFIKASLTFED